MSSELHILAMFDANGDIIAEARPKHGDKLRFPTDHITDWQHTVIGVWSDDNDLLTIDLETSNGKMIVDRPLLINRSFVHAKHLARK